MSRVSLSSQAAAVEAFIKRNCTIEAGPKGNLHREHMKAAAETLRWMERHEAEIRTAVKRGNNA